jgi:putative DNA-invertase from lambdoid prophage Rac
LQHLAQLIGELQTHRAALVASSQGIDTSESNPAGRLQMQVLAAAAEFERSVMVERINRGFSSSAPARRKAGPAANPSNRHVSSVAKLRRGGLSGRKIAAKLNIPEGSVFAVLKRAKSNEYQAV